MRGTDVIPKSVTASRIEANFDIDGWELDDDEFKAISSMTERFKVCGDAWLPIKVFFGDDE
jgi:glycerol 2-dehydrogenase (NADP+)